MRYRVVTDRSLPARTSLPRAPRLAPRLSVVASPGMFAALAWPGTARDVQWSSAPHVGRSPAGWASQGFTR